MVGKLIGTFWLPTSLCSSALPFLPLHRPLRAGQVYNVVLSLSGLENPDAADPKSKVRTAGPAHVWYRG